MMPSRPGLACADIADHEIRIVRRRMPLPVGEVVVRQCRQCLGVALRPPEHDGLASCPTSARGGCRPSRPMNPFSWASRHSRTMARLRSGIVNVRSSARGSTVMGSDCSNNLSSSVRVAGSIAVTSRLPLTRRLAPLSRDGAPASGRGYFLVAPIACTRPRHPARCRHLATENGRWGTMTRRLAKCTKKARCASDNSRRIHVIP